MLPRGIQTRISLTLLTLLLISMILVDLVLLMVLQNQFILFEGERADQYLIQFQEDVHSRQFSVNLQERQLNDILKQLPVLGEKGCLAIIAGDHFVSTGACADAGYMKQHIRAAIRTGHKMQSRVGRSWAVFNTGPQFICISKPLSISKSSVSGVGLMLPLDPYYAILRQSQKIFGFYLLVNVILLSIGGYYFISRIFMRPIKRLADRADQYEDDDELLFTVRLEDGELNKLSLALNHMMDRISKDKEKLQQNVVALETANLELKKAQKEVVRAEKLASVGRLSAGIAHEIGNPIGIILGYIELLKSGEQDMAERQDYLARAEVEVLRVNSIIRQLLNLSRPMQAEPQKISVHAFLKDLIDSVKIHPLLADTEIHLSAQAPRDQIIADPNHLRQVCLNLMINATDAIKSSENTDSGIIKIHTSLKEITQKAVDAALPMIAIEISDNGQGILESEMGNIFDPFYTTKDPGKGTGLGLSVSLTIIEQMGGNLVAESQYGRGTTLIISLPLADR